MCLGWCSLWFPIAGLWDPELKLTFGLIPKHFSNNDNFCFICVNSHPSIQSTHWRVHASPFFQTGTSDWLEILQQSNNLDVTVVSTHEDPQFRYIKVSYLQSQRSSRHLAQRVVVGERQARHWQAFFLMKCLLSTAGVMTCRSVLPGALLLAITGQRSTELEGGGGVRQTADCGCSTLTSADLLISHYECWDSNAGKAAVNLI